MISYDLPPHRGLLWLQKSGPIQVCRVHKLQQFVVEISRGILFSFIYGAAEVDEEELDDPVLDEEGWARRLCVWHTNRTGSF